MKKKAYNIFITITIVIFLMCLVLPVRVTGSRHRGHCQVLARYHARYLLDYLEYNPEADFSDLEKKMKVKCFMRHYVLNPDFKIWKNAVNKEDKTAILLIMYFNVKCKDSFFVAVKYEKGKIRSFVSDTYISFGESY